MYGRIHSFLSLLCQMDIFIFSFMKAALWRNWDMNHFNFTFPYPDPLFQTPNVFSIP